MNPWLKSVTVRGVSKNAFCRSGLARVLTENLLGPEQMQKDKERRNIE